MLRNKASRFLFKNLRGGVAIALLTFASAAMLPKLNEVTIKDVSAQETPTVIPPVAPPFAPTIVPPTMPPIELEVKQAAIEPVVQPQPIPSNPQLASISRLKDTQKRWIEIRLRSQRLVAWEGNKQVYAVIVSTGKAGHGTPSGTFAIQSMHRLARMQGADYDVPDVPFTMYYDGNYAVHGAYWHHRFGTPVSHGCTNVAPDHAEWLFNWAAIGTPVVVHSEA